MGWVESAVDITIIGFEINKQLKEQLKICKTFTTYKKDYGDEESVANKSFLNLNPFNIFQIAAQPCS